MSLAAVNAKLQIESIDTGGNTTTRDFELIAAEDAGDITDINTAVATIVAAFIAASDSVVKSTSIILKKVENALTLPASAEVENNAQINAKISGKPNKSAVFEIPAPKATLFQQTTGPGYNQVDFADTAVANYVNLFKVDPTGVAYISDGESITAQDIRGKRVHHKSTKG